MTREKRLPQWRARCFVVGCDVAVPKGHLMCRRHWDIVPLELQREVYKANERRERDKTGEATRDYIRVARMAREVVAKVEKEA